MRHREEKFVATAPNQAWSLDFVTDQPQDGRRFRALTIVDVYTRQSVAIEVGQSLKGEDMVRTLNRMKYEGCVPKFLFCDNALSSSPGICATGLPARERRQLTSSREAHGRTAIARASTRSCGTSF